MVILEITGFWENGAISFLENGAILFWEIGAVLKMFKPAKFGPYGRPTTENGATFIGLAQ